MSEHVDSMGHRPDGRYVDTTLGILDGEAAQQDAKRPEERMLSPQPEPWREMPSLDASDPTYYDRPLLKSPVWEIDIPVYYFLGGGAGAVLALGAAAQLAGSGVGLEKFGQRCHWIGIAGSSLGGLLLVHDLGRPARFLNMLRVFRPTSPMNMGVWILSGAAPLAMAAGLFTGRPGWLGMLGKAAGLGSGFFGALLAGYTGVLVSNSAIPIYQHVRRIMPVLFIASGMATAGSALDLMEEDARSSRIAFQFGTVGRVAELAAGFALEAKASEVERVGLPLRQGLSGALWRTATVLTSASLVLSVVPLKWPAKRKWAGALGLLGSLSLRLAVHYAGPPSARDARASFRAQHAGFGAREVTG